MKLRIHEIIPCTEVNGPGRRFAIWVQGCFQNCPDCFNPKAKCPDGGYGIEVDKLCNQIFDTEDIEGISISGGEPLEQSEALFELLTFVKEKSKLTTLVFTGLSLHEIEQYTKLLPLIDQLVLNYHTSLNNEGLTNNFISSTQLPQEIEVHIMPDGSVKLTGFPTISDIEILTDLLDDKNMDQ